nr:hypothetical protein [uncultured Olsenella sp.]
MDQIEASAIFASTGRPRDGMGCVAATIVGVATTDSSEGVVMVDLGGDALSVDESQAVEAETTVDVRAGDVVRVTTDGVPGHRRSVTVTGVVGGGDRTAEAVGAASDAAKAAMSSAEAATRSAQAAMDALAPVQADVDAMRGEVTSQAEAVKGLQSDVRSHYDEQRETAALVTDHATSIQQTAARLETVAASTERLTTDTAKVKEDVAAAQASLASAQESLARLTEDQGATASQVQAAQAAVDKAQTAVDAATSKLSALESQVADHESRIKQTSSAITSEVTARKATDARVDQLGTRVTQTAASIDAAVQADVGNLLPCPSLRGLRVVRGGSQATEADRIIAYNGSPSWHALSRFDGVSDMDTVTIPAGNGPANFGVGLVVGGSSIAKGQRYVFSAMVWLSHPDLSLSIGDSYRSGGSWTWRGGQYSQRPAAGKWVYVEQEMVAPADADLWIYVMSALPDAKTTATRTFRLVRPRLTASQGVLAGDSGMGSLDTAMRLDSSGLTIGRRVGSAWQGLRQLLTGSATRFLDAAGNVVAEWAADEVTMLGGAIQMVAERGATRDHFRISGNPIIDGYETMISGDHLHILGHTGLGSFSLNSDSGSLFKRLTIGSGGTKTSCVRFGSTVATTDANGRAYLFGQSWQQSNLGRKFNIASDVWIVASGDMGASDGWVSGEVRVASGTNYGDLGFRASQKNRTMRVQWLAILGA